jgi:hypothetical protein
MSKFKHTREIINSRLKSRNISMLDEYKGQSIKVKFECDKNHTWLATPGNVLRATGCPHCHGGVGYTDEQMYEIKSLLDQRGITMGIYKNSITKVAFECKNHHKWQTVLESVITGTGCPYCSKRPPLTKDIVNEKLIGRNIKLISDYKSCHSKAMFECSNGHTWMSVPDNVVRKEQGCPQCYLDFTKPAYIYVLDIIGEDDKFTGFGISNSKISRIAKHISILNKSNKKIIRKKIFSISTRFIALDIEKTLKISLPIYNSNITGFITEATKLDFETVIQIIDSYIIERDRK